MSFQGPCICSGHVDSRSDISTARAIDNIATSLLPRTLSRWRVIHTRVHRIGKPSGASWDAAGGISAGAALLDRIARSEGSSKATMVELRGLEPLTFSLRTRRATNCAIAPQTAWGRSARRLYHRQAEADFCDSSPFTACDESDGASGASAVTGPSWDADDVAPGPERSMVRTVRGASGFET